MSEQREWIGYHWLRDDRRLNFADDRVVKVGVTYTNPLDDSGKPAPIKLCEVGYHASKRALDALQHAPGPVCCIVRLSGEILDGDDKSCATERTVLAMADATNVLHEFACRVAEKALKAAKVEDVRCWNAIETKRKWLKGEATDAELAASWSAARAAVWSVVAATEALAAAARSASGSASGSAARAARAAALSASWSAVAATEALASAARSARAAARSAANDVLEAMLADLFAEAGFAITGTKGS